MRPTYDDLMQEWLFGVPNEELYAVQQQSNTEWKYITEFIYVGVQPINVPVLRTYDETMENYKRSIGAFENMNHRLVKVSRFLQPYQTVVPTHVLKSTIK